jgi:hypothetical protein
MTLPTLSSPAIRSDGLHLTATFSIPGMTPTSGSDAGGIAVHVSGGTPNVTGWSISGTTLTLMLDEAVLQGSVVTYDYVGPAPAFDSANFEDGSSNAMAAFSGVTVANSSGGPAINPALNPASPQGFF